MPHLGDTRRNTPHSHTRSPAMPSGCVQLKLGRSRSFSGPFRPQKPMSGRPAGSAGLVVDRSDGCLARCFCRHWDRRGRPQCPHFPGAAASVKTEWSAICNPPSTCRCRMGLGSEEAGSESGDRQRAFLSLPSGRTCPRCPSVSPAEYVAHDGGCLLVGLGGSVGVDLYGCHAAGVAESGGDRR